MSETAATPAARKILTEDERILRREARIRRAAVKLSVIDDRRAAARLFAAGKPPREIAGILLVAQSVVDQLLRAAELLGTDETPEEVIFRAAVDKTSRDALVEKLIGWNYTFAEYAPYPGDGRVLGTWDQVSFGYFYGMLSKGEYAQIRQSVRPPIPE